MGQYHVTVNLDKREFIKPYPLGDGAKLLEQCGWSPGGTNDALHLLLACSSGRGGGDFQSARWTRRGKEADRFVGRWAGDRIAVVGDYAENGDLAAKDGAQRIYSLCGKDDEVPLAKQFCDITPDLIPTMEREYEVLYVGEGWCDRIDLSSRIEKWGGSHGMGDRTGIIDGREFPMSAIREAVRAAFLKRERGAYHAATLTLAELTKAGLPAAAAKVRS